MSKTETRPAGRRGFFKAATAAAATAVAAAAPVRAARAAESDADKKKARYTESEHVKKFYQTNRY